MNYLRIKQILKDKKLTGKELARIMGLTENAVSLIVNGKSQPRYETLAEIAKVLDVDIRELFKKTKADTDEPVDIFVIDGSGEKVRIGQLLKAQVQDL